MDISQVKDNADVLYEKTILSLLRCALFGEGSASEISLTEDDLDELRQQAVEAVPRDIISSVQISDELKSKWEKCTLKVSVRHIQIMREQQKLVDLLLENGIKPVILKGASAAMYYPSFDTRNMGDIDFIVKHDSFEKACGILSENGYISSDGYNNRHFCYEKNGVHFELHHHFSVGMKKAEADCLDDLLENSIDSAEKHCINNYTWYSFDYLTNGLVLLFHLKNHLYSGLGLRQVIDWMMYVYSGMTDEQWGQFSIMAAKCGGLELATLATGMCIMYLGLPDKYEWCREFDKEKSRKLMDYILLKGNMGRRQDANNSRSISALNAADKGLIGRLKYEQKSGLIHWKATKKYRILRPFAWIYGIGHHIRALNADGENIVKVFENIKKSNSQRDLLDELLNN